MNLTEVLIAAILSLAIFGVSYGFYAESREETNMERTCENLTALAGNIRVHRSDDLAGLLAMDVEGLRRADIIPPYFIGPNQEDADNLVLKTPFGTVSTGTGSDGESTYWTFNLSGLNGRDCYRVLRTARAKNLWDGAGTTKGTVVKSDELTDTKLIELCGKKGYDGTALMAMKTGAVVATSGGGGASKLALKHMILTGKRYGFDYKWADGSAAAQTDTPSGGLLDDLVWEAAKKCWDAGDNSSHGCSQAQNTYRYKYSYYYEGTEPLFSGTLVDTGGKAVSTDGDTYSLSIDNVALNNYLSSVRQMITEVYGSSEKFDTYMAGVVNTDTDISFSMKASSEDGSKFNPASILHSSSDTVQALVGQLGVHITKNSDGTYSATTTNAASDKLIHEEIIFYAD